MPTAADGSYSARKLPTRDSASGIRITNADSTGIFTMIFPCSKPMSQTINETAD
jgi:hypothetical protein